MSAGPAIRLFLSCQDMPWAAKGSTTPTPTWVAPRTQRPTTTLVMVPLPLGAPNWKVMSAVAPLVLLFFREKTDVDGCQTPTVWNPWPVQSPMIGTVCVPGLTPLLAGPKSTCKTVVSPVRNKKVDSGPVTLRSDCGPQTPTVVAAPALSLA